MTRALLVATVLLAAPVPGVAAQERGGVESVGFAGTWGGRVNIDGVDQRIRCVLTEAEGVLQFTEYSVKRGNVEEKYTYQRGDPFQSTVNGNTISLTMSAVRASYTGTLSRVDGRITGTFTREGRTFPLVLDRVDRAGARADEAEVPTSRPQDPEEPFPYLAEDVTYANPIGGHTLAGTFTRPASGGPFPAVILISGSGPHDRDGAGVGHRPFLVVADHLTRRGIAVLRYDDRGVGGSTGEFAPATSRDLASDALAAVAYLKGRDDVDPGRIGLAGHSEGGLIAPMVAVESPDVSYIVLMAAPGVRGERLAAAQTELINRAAGVSEEEIAEMVEQLKAATATDPWFRYFLTYEPAEMIEQVTVPVLAINGEKDLQVPHEENLREIEAALQRGGNTRYEIRAFPDLNHLFQHAETGAPSEYQAIEETWSVEVMEVIADWILKTVGG